MGHSAGAHLVALITSSRALAGSAAIRSWRGSLILDSAALDEPAITDAVDRFVDSLEVRRR